MYEDKIKLINQVSKFCSFCQTYLPKDSFAANKSKEDGRNSRCRDCMMEYRRMRKLGENTLKIQKNHYYIPDIYIVGFGRLQTYQVCCLKCESPFFCLMTYKEIQDLFCENCVADEDLIKPGNVAKYNYIGNVVGWIVKAECVQKKRRHTNYKKCYVRDKYTCQYCGYNLSNATEFRPLHIDHVRPWSSSGGNGLNNLVVSCCVCNQIASDKWFVDFEEKKNYITDMLFLKNRKENKIDPEKKTLIELNT